MQEAALAGPSRAPTLAHDSVVVPCFRDSSVFLQRHSLLQMSSILSPRVISLQPTAVLAPGLLSNTHALASRPCAHQYTCVPVQGIYSSWHIDCRVVLTLTRLSQISCFTLPVASNASLLSQPISPDAITHSLLQLPHPGVQVPSCLLFYSLFSFFLPSYAWIHMALPSGRTLASIQPVFCESCCVCREIPDASVERDALHDHLLLCSTILELLIMIF